MLFKERAIDRAVTDTLLKRAVDVERRQLRQQIGLETGLADGALELFGRCDSQ